MEIKWRWVDQNGRAMTEWSTQATLPPPHLREVTDERGTIRVEFQGEEDVV